jgi:Phage tail tube protein
MTVGVGAMGFVGVAVETVPGTYVAPTHYMLLRNESLQYVQETNWRRPLRGIADIADPTQGYLHTEGDLEVEVTEDILPQLLRTARVNIVKTGVGPFTYTITPTHVAVPAKTMSITIVRNGLVFGYTGCIISSQKYSMDNASVVASFGILGLDETVQSLPTPAYVTTLPFGAGQYTLEIPTGASVLDTDTWELNIDDSGEHQFRIKPTRSAAFAKYGERSVDLSLERDFEARTEYDAFKTLTAKAIKLKCVKSAAVSEVNFEIKASIVDSYEIAGLSGQADLIRGSVKYKGIYDSATSKAYEIICITAASITVP